MKYARGAGLRINNLHGNIKRKMLAADLAQLADAPIDNEHKDAMYKDLRNINESDMEQFK